jgi:hypothetical protein
MLQLDSSAQGTDFSQVGTKPRTLPLDAMASGALSLTVEQQFASCWITICADSVDRHGPEVRDNGSRLKFGICRRRHWSSGNTTPNNADQIGIRRCLAEPAVAEVHAWNANTVRAMAIRAIGPVKSPTILDIRAAVIALSNGSDSGDWKYNQQKESSPQHSGSPP